MDPQNVPLIYPSNKLTLDQMKESLQQFTLWDYLIVLLVLIICIAIGCYFALREDDNSCDNDKVTKTLNHRNKRSREFDNESIDYFLAGRKMSSFPVAISIIMSLISTQTLLVTPSEIYIHGIQYLLIFLFPIVISVSFCWNIVLPVISNLQLTSIFEYLEFRFDRRTRLFSSLAFSIGMIVWLPVVIYVPVIALNQVLGVDSQVLVSIVCVGCIFYTCLGGLRAVVWTDVFLFLILFGSLALSVGNSALYMGSFDEILNRIQKGNHLMIPTINTDPTNYYSIWSIIFFGVFQWVYFLSYNATVTQRFLATSSLKSSKCSLVIFTVAILITLSGLILVGSVMFANYFYCDPLLSRLVISKDQLLPLFATDMLRKLPGLTGLFVIGFFSGAMSLLASSLNSLATTVSEDLIKPYLGEPLNEKQNFIILKSAIIVFGLFLIGLIFEAQNSDVYVNISLTIDGIIKGSLLGIFIMGFCCPWINAKSALTGGVLSPVILIWIFTKIHVYAPEIIFTNKSVQNCGYYIGNITLIDNLGDVNISKAHMTSQHPPFLWYIPSGTILTIIFANLAMIIFGYMNPNDIDFSLLAPCLRKCIRPRKFISVQPDFQERRTVIQAYDVVRENNENDRSKN